MLKPLKQQRISLIIKPGRLRLVPFLKHASVNSSTNAFRITKNNAPFYQSFARDCPTLG
jgi:hypothetical protein